MYRINFYPEGINRRVARSRRLRQGALLAAAFGVQALLMGLFIDSGLTLKTRAEAAEQRVAAEKMRLLQPGDPQMLSAVRQARLLLQRRIDRRDWYPVVVELSRLLPERMVLDRIEATGDQPGGEAIARMTLTGHLASGSEVDPVVDFAQRLSASPAYREEFEDARVDRVDTSGEVARFTIICRLRTQSAVGQPPVGEGINP